MATQSSPPPNPTNESPSNPAADIVQPPYDNQQNSRAEQIKQISPPSVFVNSEPIREDQVQNAVKFLSHPKVRGSPVVYRRSFLEKKGLTKEEIDEAFRLVPDSSPSSQPASVSQDRQFNPISNLQSQVPQTLQPAAAPAGFVSSVGTLAQTSFRWYHAILAVGFLAISGAGTAVLVKNALVPRLKSWIRKVVLDENNDSGGKINAKPTLAEETAAAANATAAAAADMAKASQAMLSSKHEEKKYFEELMKLLDVQVKEMKSMSSSIQKLEEQTIYSRNTSYIAQEDNKVSTISSKQQNFSQQAYVNGKVDSDSHSVRSSSPPTYVEPSVAPHPKSYVDIMAMVQRGEKPPNIRDINDLPPYPNQQIPNPRIAPRTKPWDLGPADITSNQVVQSQVGTEAQNSSAQYNGMKYVSDGEKSVPWRQQKSARITEIESEDEAKAANSGGRVQRRWVPPQAPPVAMPEAAEAIRRPKPVELTEDDESRKYEDDEATDELQRVTKISESGGEMESNGAGFGVDSSEIQVE